MKTTIRLLALLSVAALAACAEPVTAPTISAEADAQMSSGQGFMGGGTR